MILKTQTNGSAMEEVTKKVSLVDARVDNRTLVIMRVQKAGNVLILTIAISIFVKCASDGVCTVKQLEQIWDWLHHQLTVVMRLHERYGDITTI